jgi:hypothetical protein
MSKFEKRLETYKLRRKGRSIRSIATQLSVAKSTVSIWCGDLKLTQKQKEHLLKNAIKAGHKGRLIGAEMNRKKKQRLIDFYKRSAKKEIRGLSLRDFLIAGVALYWGEGSKSDKLTFSNSDPIMIKFMFRWFQKIVGVKKEEFMPRIFINEMHKPRIKKVIKFWVSLLGLPVEQFGNPTFLKMTQKKIYENYNSYYGILALRIRKSTNLKYRILGLIDALKNQK